MNRYNFGICCTDTESKDRLAVYKIAAEWVLGGYSELKTYGFADDECLSRVVRAAQERIARHRFADGEWISEIHIYRLDSSRHDHELERCAELEKLFTPATVA